MDQYRALKHISVVHVVSASELSAEQIQMLKSKIESSPVGFENVEIHTRIDPSLIGGFVVELDDKVLDASVRHHLEGLRKEFKTNLYESKIMAR
jgi:F-type H+-transporting ATPase subunit delta